MKILAAMSCFRTLHRLSIWPIKFNDLLLNIFGAPLFFKQTKAEMEFKISPHFPGIRPNVTLPTHEMFELLGEEGIRKMVSDHYDLVVQSPVKHLFPKNPIALEKAKEHSADFFIQICGGPDYFNKNRGMPQLNRRHRPFTITAEGRIEWLKCYQQVLSKLDLPEHVLLSFWNYLDVFSKWMVNS